MSKQKLKILATPDKTRSDKPLVQLTEAQLEAIAGGSWGNCVGRGCNENHNETMFVFGQLNLEGGNYV